MKKFGKDIFEDATWTPASSQGPGLSAAPAVTVEARAADNKTTVILPPDQVAFLDRLALDIRQTTDWKMRQTEIIRGLVAALMRADIDLTSSRSEDDTTAAVAAQLKG